MTDCLPPLLYHGTAEEFERLDPDRGNPRHPDGLGIWLTEDEATAGDFARRDGGEGIVLAVRASLRNPLVVGSFESLKDLVRESGGARTARTVLMDLGHDGIVIDRSYPNLPDTSRDVIVFSRDSVEIVERYRVASPSPSQGQR